MFRASPSPRSLGLPLGMTIPRRIDESAGSDGGAWRPRKDVWPNRHVSGIAVFAACRREEPGAGRRRCYAARG